ncbi:MAG: hypothetical protein SFW62_08360 [Alphaproteobacteria bacterium]|nr:hypothetical protein [Alphaproteobacteria bacterium]
MANSSSLASFLPPVPNGAQLYQRAVANRIGVTPATSENIGWLAKNKSQLEVVSQLTGQDPINMFNFTFQQGESIKLKLTSIDGKVPVHVQIFDGSGTRVIADNQGNSKTKEAYAQLTSLDGLKLKTGKYLLKVEYGKGADKNAKQNYAIQLGSGTTFKNDYRTLASPVTVAQTLQAGGTFGYDARNTTALMLATGAVGDRLNIFNFIT